MAVLRWVGNRLTYANVTATLALFIALGGASYAAVELPAGSVGARQLQPAAITPSKLGFPLSVASTTDKHPQDLTQDACNGGGGESRPGEPAPDCFQASLGGPTPGREVHVHLQYPARLDISAVVGLTKDGATTTHAKVALGLVLDRGSAIASSAASINGGQTIQVPVQAVVAARAGTHTVGLADAAEYFGSGPGDVFVGPVTVTVTALSAGH